MNNGEKWKLIHFKYLMSVSSPNVFETWGNFWNLSSNLLLLINQILTLNFFKVFLDVIFLFNIPRADSPSQWLIVFSAACLQWIKRSISAGERDVFCLDMCQKIIWRQSTHFSWQQKSVKQETFVSFGPSSFDRFRLSLNHCASEFLYHSFWVL